MESRLLPVLVRFGIAEQVQPELDGALASPPLLELLHVYARQQSFQHCGSKARRAPGNRQSLTACQKPRISTIMPQIARMTGPIMGSEVEG